MQLSFGTYAHQQNECAVAIAKTPLLNDAGYQYGAKEQWTIAGYLQAASQDALVPLCNALEIAYSTNYLPLTLMSTDGTIRARGLAGRTRLGGTRVIGGVSYPDDGASNAEFTTFRRYQIVVESSYLLPNVSPFVILSWMESIEFSGGGPRFIHLQPLVGIPQRQQVAQATPFKVSQAGRAVGLLGYPTPAAPLWPYSEHIDQRRVKRETPKRAGDGVANVYTEWPVTWAYEFEDAIPMDGQPTLWRN